MPTKQYTGPIDCLGAALPDEEYFVFLARDPIAPWLTVIWACVRVGNLAAATDNFRLMFQGGLLEHYVKHPDVAKSEEAMMVAQRMTDWRQANLGGPGGTPTWKESLVRPKMLDVVLVDEHADLLRKLQVGLRQVGKNLADYSMRDDLVNMTEDTGFALEAMGQYADRINGYAAEIDAVLGDKPAQTICGTCQEFDCECETGPGFTTPASSIHLAGHLNRCKARASGLFRDCDCHPEVRQ